MYVPGILPAKSRSPHHGLFLRKQHLLSHALTDSNFASTCLGRHHQTTRFWPKTLGLTPLTAHVLPCLKCLLTCLFLPLLVCTMHAANVSRFVGMTAGNIRLSTLFFSAGACLDIECAPKQSSTQQILTQFYATSVPYVQCLVGIYISYLVPGSTHIHVEQQRQQQSATYFYVPQ